MRRPLPTRPCLTRVAPAAAALAALAAAVALAAAAAEPTHAGLRVLATIEGLLVQVGDAPPFPAEAAGGVATYALLPAGESIVVLWQAQEDEPATPGVRLASVDLDLEGGAYYTLTVSYPSVIDLAAPAAATQHLESALLRDAIERLPPAGHASLRITHASPLSGEFVVAIRAFDAEAGDAGESEPRAGADPNDVDGEPLALVALQPLQSSDRFDLLEGVYAITPHRAGPPWRGEPLLYTLHSGVAYTLYLSSVSPEDAVARLVVDAAAPAPPQTERR